MPKIKYRFSLSQDERDELQAIVAKGKHRLLIDAGLPPTTVQHQLGHHSAQFTLDVYAKRVKRKESITSVLDATV